MTCPTSHTTTSESAPTSIPPDPDGNIAEGAVRGDAVERFERVSGSVFVGLFGAAAFDQPMMPAVSAALEDTGRFRDAPVLRGLRSVASDQIMFVGDATDRREEAERLVRLHREVKGVDADGNRYSALEPELWNWIMISTFFTYRNAVAVIGGDDFSDADNQAIWNRFREMVADVQLPGRSRLTPDYHDLCTYYDSVVADKLQVTPTLRSVTSSVLRPPRPDFVPVVAAPLWGIVAPVAGHVTAVLGFGVMHPGVRALVPMNWTRRHDLEFHALSFLVRTAYRILPTTLTDTPLTRNRRKYQRLIAKYKGIGLTSFAAS